LRGERRVEGGAEGLSGERGGAEARAPTGLVLAGSGWIAPGVKGEAGDRFNRFPP
jgi:hypothetical protein